MLGHAIVDSCATRMMLSYPLRSGALYLSSRRCAVLPVTLAVPLLPYRRRNYNTGNPEWNGANASMGMENVKKVRKTEEELSSDYTSTESVLGLLEAEVREWMRGDKKALGIKMCKWGLQGKSLKAILTTSDPEHPKKDGSNFGVMTALLQLWGVEAVNNLQSTTSSSSSTTFDLENAKLGIAIEGIGCIERLLMNYFLRWLESQLKKQPEGGRLLSHTQQLLSLADMRYPSLKYEEARRIVRQIHLHVGPTNSGKTHGALVALCKANTGCYAGPLRLLAHEVWERIRKGTVSPGVPARPCNLITGEEVKMDSALAGLSSCTVEMLNFQTLVDVAVVDEIQMIADSQRGTSWTTAVLGLPAKELHLCGESSVIPLIKKMVEACGDVLHIHEYKRLTPLKIGPSLGGDLKQIKKGDCIVAFSRTEIFELKNRIERFTPFKCALAYGSLPPETKSEQARKFNDPDNDVSVMVASDAIGMGLNLKIKRVIFSKVTKWNGTEVVPVTFSQLKQIAGRAGRYGTSEEDAAGGLATTLQHEDLDVLKDALEAPLIPITRARIQPSSGALTALATLLSAKKKLDFDDRGRQRSLTTLYSDLNLLSQIDSRIYLAGSYELQMRICPILVDHVSAFSYMNIADRELFATAPANHRDERMVALFSNMVNYYARGGLIKFDDADCLDMLKTLKKVETAAKAFNLQNKENPFQERSINLATFFKNGSYRFNIDDLVILESLHRGLTLYLWLSYRRSVAFCYRDDAEDYSRRTEKAIDFCLEAVKAVSSRGNYYQTFREKGAFGKSVKPWAKMTFKEKQRHKQENLFKKGSGMAPGGDFKQNAQYSNM